MFSSLKSKLLTICIASIVVAMLVQLAANYMAAQKTSAAAVETQLAEATRSASAGLAVWVHAKTLIVNSMQAAAELPDAAKSILKVGAQAGDFEKAFIAYPDKRYTSTDATTAADFDPTTRPWYLQAVKDGSPGITKPYKSVSSGNIIVTVVAPMGRAGAPSAVVGGNVTLTHVTADVAAIKPTEHSFAFLVDAAGDIVAHVDSKLVLTRATGVAPALTAETLMALSQSQATHEDTVNGRAVYLRVAKIEGAPWFVVVALDKADATAGLAAMLKTSSIAATVAIGLAILALFTLLSRALARLNDVRDAMQDVASGDGDLTIRISDEGRDELAQIAGAYNQFAEKLAVVLRGIRSSSESVRVGAEEIAVGNMDLSSRTEQQAGSLEETASAMEELTATVLQNADNSRQANQMAIAASTVAESGGAAVAKVVATMDIISASAKQIADITSVIDNIAFQTNILSLNAAVEAARAGEQGRGFAVVASEVRSLAQRSAAAAKEIRALINESAQQVAAGNELAHAAGATMDNVVLSIKKVTDVMAEISAASREQSSGIALVNKAITEMDTVTQQNAALVEEAAAAADSLQQQSSELAEAVGAFKLD